MSAAPREPCDRAVDCDRIGRRRFYACAVFALTLQAVVLFSSPGLRGGFDLLIHLRLMQLMEAEPALRSVYPPAYHALGALLAQFLGFALFTKLFAMLGSVLLIAGFRVFQRAARLPDEAACLFALWPYLLALVWSIPKVEMVGYAFALLAFAMILRGKRLAVAIALAAAFLFHTAAALFLGLCGGVLCLVRRDVRGLGALGLGSLLASPLLAAHLVAGCSLLQSFLFSQADYLRSQSLWSFRVWDVVLLLMNPLAVVAALAGVRQAWIRHREVSIVCAVVLVLYLNELWLAPLGTGTTLNLFRGLTLLAIPVSVFGGIALARRPRWVAWILLLSSLWLASTAFTAVPRAFFSRPIALLELEELQVERCTFRGRGPNVRLSPRPLR
jgi:hypothetical protein